MVRNLQDLHEDPAGHYIRRKLKPCPLVTGSSSKYSGDKPLEKYDLSEEQ